MDMFLKIAIDGIMIGGVYALVALGVVVISKSSKVFNIGHGDIMMFLAYLLWWLLVPKDLPLPIAALLLVVFSIMLGLFCERVLTRRLIGRPMLNAFIVTLTFGTVVKGVSVLWFGGTPQALPGVIPGGHFSVAGITLSYTTLCSFVAACAMFLVFSYWFRFTKAGLDMRAVAEDHLVSQSLGIDAKKIFALAWVIGCLAAAAGGVLMGSMYVVDSSLGGFAIMRALPVLLLGGIESVTGAFVGAIIIGLVESLAIGYIDPHITGFSEVLPYVFMLAIMMLRPSGLFGQKTIERI
jgi:branched-chain amino acid transport system permease protein